MKQVQQSSEIVVFLLYDKNQLVGQFIRGQLRDGQDVEDLDLIRKISKVILYSAQRLFRQRFRTFRQDGGDVVSSVERAGYYA